MQSYFSIVQHSSSSCCRCRSVSHQSKEVLLMPSLCLQLILTEKVWTLSMQHSACALTLFHENGYLQNILGQSIFHKTFHGLSVHFGFIIIIMIIMYLPDDVCTWYIYAPSNNYPHISACRYPTVIINKIYAFSRL